MMIVRSLLLVTALLAASAASAQTREDAIAAPVLRASVIVSGDLVRIGDVIDNAGTSAQIAIYRAPDLGTTGSLPTAQVLGALRAHQVIGVDTGPTGFAARTAKDRHTAEARPEFNRLGRFARRSWRCGARTVQHDDNGDYQPTD